MKRLFLYAGPLGVLGWVAGLVTLVLSVLTIFFPDVVQDTATGVAGPAILREGGDPRPEYVASQVIAFWYALSVLSVVGAVAFAGLFHVHQTTTAQKVAVGEDPPGRLTLFAALGVVTGLIGLVTTYLAPQFFELTASSVELQRQFSLFAWAARSWVGGVLLGVGLAAVCAILGTAVYFVSVVLPKDLQRRKLNRRLSRAQA